MNTKRKAGHPKKAGRLYLISIRTRNEQMKDFIVRHLTPEDRAEILLNSIAVVDNEFVAQRNLDAGAKEQGK